MDHRDRALTLAGTLAGIRVYLETIERYRALGLAPGEYLTSDAMALIDRALVRDDPVADGRMRAVGDILASPQFEPAVFRDAA